MTSCVLVYIDTVYYFQQGCTVAAMDCYETIWMQKEERDEVPNEPGPMVQIYPPSVNGKEEIEENVKQEVPENPLKMEVCGHHTKQDPELIQHVDDSGNNVATSTTYEPDSAKLIQISGERSAISFEETVAQGVLDNELEKGADDSRHFIMFGTHRWGLTEIKQEEEDQEQEDRLFGTRLNCSLKDIRYNTHTVTHNSEKRVKYNNYRTSCETTSEDDHSVQLAAKRVHKCEVCGKSFARLSDSKKHSLVHTGKRSYKCDVCGKAFSQLGNLRSHASIHTGNRPHKCDVCGESFVHNYSLKRHSLSHIGIKPHKCNVCGKSYTLHNTLKIHSLTHTGMKPHKCNVCGKSFTYYNTLKTHSLIHTGIKPHKCDVCGKSFTHLGSLKRHSFMHTGIYPHKCDICGNAFNCLSNLKRHVLIHTGIIPHTSVSSA